MVGIFNFIDLRLGPVWDIKDFSIEANKEGFNFKKVPADAFSFTSERLSQLKVTFVDSETKEL